jgi:hypothetical protein
MRYQPLRISAGIREWRAKTVLRFDITIGRFALCPRKTPVF